MAFIIAGVLVAWCVAGAAAAVLVGGAFRRGWAPEAAESTTTTVVVTEIPAPRSATPQGTPAAL